MIYGHNRIVPPFPKLRIMSQIEDEYKKRFNQQELSNGDFDSEGLWGAIAEDLDQTQPKENQQKRRFLFFFLLLTGALIGTYYFSTSSQQIVENTVGNYANTDSNAEANTEANAEANVNTQKALNSLVLSSKEAEQQNLPTKTAKKAAPTAESVKTIHATPELTQAPLKESRAVKPLATIEKEVRSTRTNEIRSTVFPVENNSTKKQSVAAEKQPVENLNPPAPQAIDRMSMSLSTLPTLLSFVKSDADLQVPLPVLNRESDPLKKEKSFAWQIGVWGGSNLINFNYKSDNSPDLAKLKAQAETGELGISLGLNTTLSWKNRWLFNTGIEYHRLWSKFETKQQKSIQINKENQLLKAWTDGFTGDTLNRQYGDITIDGIATRTVVHYNQYQQFSIPIEIGLQQTSQQLVYGVTLGGILNFTTKQSGKTLSKDAAVIDFDTNNAMAPFKKFSIGLRVNPFVGYRISTAWTIKVHPQWTWQAGANFDDTDLKLNIHQFNLNLGLAYSFD